MNWVDEIITQYYAWLKDKTKYVLDNETQWARIATPFVGLFNDPVEIFVKRTGNGFLLSDDGETVRNLALSGVDLSKSAKRRDWADGILYNYGVKLENNELTVTALASDLPERKHDLICAIEDTISLESTTRRNVSSFFREDVKQMLDDRNVIYTAAYPAIGSTGIRFIFDFQVATRTTETVIKAFGDLNRINVPNFLFAFEDIRENRHRQTNKDIRAVAVIDDRDGEPKPEYLNALQSRDIALIPWSKRNTPDNISKIPCSSAS